MAANSQCFVEWKEQFVSKERGKRVVHYYLKDLAGDSILSVVGTERSVRHMSYVVADDFLKVNEAENSVNAGYRWRSRREVVNWLTSMLSKQHRQGENSNFLKSDHIFGVGASYHNRVATNVNAQDIVWSGVAWSCGKQLKHFPAFCRNTITIAVQSFVFVMAEEEKRHLAYLEDMYEDRKGQKKVRVRWFHHNQEVQGVVALKNPHPKEVFITPYTQVISVECVDGPAIVLTREHYEKCVSILPEYLLTRVHFCLKQFNNNHVKPFKLSKLCGYFDQPFFSVLETDCFEDEKRKRIRNPSLDVKIEMLRRKLIPKYTKNRDLIPSFLKVNEKIEVLCQDSGIRGCWFRCTIMQVSKRQLKVQYDDLKDVDENSNLEEWIPAFRLAIPEKLGMRCSGRSTMRPARVENETNYSVEVGSPVDAWWSDGWWEGFVSGIDVSRDGIIQVYIPGETVLLEVHKKNIRLSKDWVGNRWINLESKPDILSLIPPNLTPKMSEMKNETLAPVILSDPEPIQEEKKDPSSPHDPEPIQEDKKDPNTTHDPEPIQEYENDPSSPHDPEPIQEYENNPSTPHDPEPIQEDKKDPNTTHDPEPIQEDEKDPSSPHDDNNLEIGEKRENASGFCEAVAMEE